MPPAQSPSDGSRDYVDGRLLDGFLLLAAGGSSSPDDVVSVNLSSLQIVDVASEDLAFFVNLDSLDVSDNQLSYEQVIEQFGQLPRLCSLFLACNSITSLQVPPRALRNLQALDLSFNELHGDVLAQLANLPSLVSLNLSSNCISSVPPEEDLDGLQALEELCLDANDLVQFVQWRALDALPRLRKLSLASNRVKRLKDDAPDLSNTSYFMALEELDLCSNEIAGVDSLPAVRLFPALQILHLGDNPCTRNAGAVPTKMPGTNASIVVQESTPWYLRGNGSFKRPKTPKEPKLKLDRKKLHKVRSKISQKEKTRQGRNSQLGVLDEEANQLIVSLRLTQPGAQADSLAPASGERHSSALGAGAHGIMNDDLSEEELDAIFRERRAKIDKAFNAPAEEPASFMNPIPFEITAQAGVKLGLVKKPEEDDMVGLFGPARGSSGTAGVFLTGVGDETLNTTGVEEPITTSGQGSVTLPPICPGSRGSSAGGLSRSSSMDWTTREERKPTRPTMDINVREAMRALRAASLSDYAVA